jgi:hypothetical protein
MKPLILDQLFGFKTVDDFADESYSSANDREDGHVVASPSVSENTMKGAARCTYTSGAGSGNGQPRLITAVPALIGCLWYLKPLVSPPRLLTPAIVTA